MNKENPHSFNDCFFIVHDEYLQAASEGEEEIVSSYLSVAKNIKRDYKGIDDETALMAACRQGTEP